MQKPIFQLLKALWKHISNRRRKQFSLLLILMIIGSFAEVISIGAVLPFLGVLVSPEKVFENQIIQSFTPIIGVTEPNQLIFPITLFFGLAVILASLMRLSLLWVSTRLSFATGADLSIQIYLRTLYQPYSVHCSRNSSEVISGITGKADSVIYLTIIPFINIINSLVIIIVILSTLFVVDAIIAMTASLSFAILYSFIIYVKRKQLMKDSVSIAIESTNLIKSLHEGLGGIRDVLIDGTQATYSNIYRKSDRALRRAKGNNIFIGGAPRFLMEAIGMLLIAFFAYILAQRPEGVSSAIPVLGALALGAQRLLPVIQTMYQSWISIKGGHASLEDALELLNQPIPEYSKKSNQKQIPFKNKIELKQIDFKYGDELPFVLENINLVISKGARVGFVGSTGSGKSTLIDIIMGLLEPTNGQIMIDDSIINNSNYRSWQNHIAHVPQSIFLADSSVEENIAFGQPKENINKARVRVAAKQAQIAAAIESWPNKYQTTVGERGIQLSGGQRQRIGIARALYKNADVIIFDEATSSLDTDTENSVMHAIEELSNELTILIVAHRISTLKNCEQIIELGKDGIQQIGTYNSIFQK